MSIRDEPAIGTLEAECHEAVVQPDGNVDLAAFRAEYERRLAERHDRLKRDATASYRAMQDWGTIKTVEQWQEKVSQAGADYDSGDFLIERLGAERYLDPTLMAVLLVLRRRLIDEHRASTAAELMMVDVVVLSYYHTLRINGWIGDLSQWLESEFFRKEGLAVTVQGQHKSSWDVKIRGLKVEEIVERLSERLLPLLDRSNRIMIRNLKALEARRQPLTPNVSIAQAGQVNVAAVQTNQLGGQADEEPEARADA
jgi:hypothetical protein